MQSFRYPFSVGEELCYQLSRLGARIILSARSEDKLKVVRKGLAKPNQAKWECISEIAINKTILFAPYSGVNIIVYNTTIVFASIFRILPIDLSDPSATREATEKAKALFGGIDILINNAGTARNSPRLFVWCTDPIPSNCRCLYQVTVYRYARAYTQTSHGSWPLCTLDTDPWCLAR